jgi:uncharacterized membrane protein YhhN
MDLSFARAPDSMVTRGMKATTVAYVMLSTLSLGLIAVPQFPAIAFIRMAPTLVLAAVALRATRPAFGFTVAAGLFFGACGDYFLNTFDADLAIYGVAAFLIGHVFYVVGFRRAGFSASRVRWAVVAALLVFAVSYGAVLLIMNPLHPVSRILPFGPRGTPRPTPVAVPVIIYTVVLVTMASIAVLRRGSRLVGAGALLFVASDAVIPLNVFLLPKAHASDFFASTGLLYPGLITYYLAQYLIALGAIRDAAAYGATDRVRVGGAEPQEIR